jgi:hypothetical protein
MTCLPRALRLDESDLSVFETAAAPGEWAVPGSFSFLDGVPTGRRRAAFAHGFLGTTSFGWTTLVRVEEASVAEMAQVTQALVRHFLRDHGAPSAEAAGAVAAREVAFAASLCDHPPGTILAVSRRFDGDALVEQFRTLTPIADPCGPHAPIDLALLAGARG